MSPLQAPKAPPPWTAEAWAQSPLLGLSLLAVAALPDQSWGGATRLVVVAALPFLYGQHLLRGPLALAWLALAGVALVHAPHLADGARWALTLACLLGGLAYGIHHREAALSARAAAAAGVLAALPGFLWRGGLFYNPGFLSGFLCLTLLLTLSGFIEGERRLEQLHERALVALSALLQMAAMIDAGGLAPLGALLLGLLILMPRWGLVGLAAGGVGAAAGWSTLSAHLEGRLHLFRVSGRVAWDHLPWGVGPGGFHAAFLEAQVGRDLDLWTNAYHAHNEPLHAAAVFGILGILLFLPLLGIRRWRRAEGAVLVAFGALALWGPALAEPATATIAAFALGRQWAPRWAPRRWGMALGALAFVVALGDWVQDQRYTAALDTDDPDGIAASRLSLRPTRRLQAEAALRMASDPAAAERLAAEALSRTPSVEGLVLLARARVARGDDRGAVEALLRALRYNPRSFAAAFNLALCYEALGDRHTARRYATRARSLRPSDPRLPDLPE